MKVVRKGTVDLTRVDLPSAEAQQAAFDMVKRTGKVKHTFTVTFVSRGK